MTLRVGVVGAGVSGLAFVHRLVEIVAKSSLGVDVKVLEWGRGPGGRLARKRAQLLPNSGRHTTTLFFDHGCPFFTIRNDFLVKMLSGGAEQTHMERCIESVHEMPDTFVGVPESNNAVVKAFMRAIEKMLNQDHVIYKTSAQNNAPEACQTQCGLPKADLSKVQYLYQRQVLKAEQDDGKGWVLVCLNRDSGTQERHEFDLVVLTDKLLFLESNVWKILNLSDVLPESDVSRLSTGIVGQTSEPRLVLMIAIRTSLDMYEHLKVSIGAKLDCKGDDVCSFIVHETGKATRALVRENDSETSCLAQLVVHSTPQYAHRNMVFNKATGQGDLKIGMEDIVLNQLFESCKQHVEARAVGSPNQTDLFNDVVFRQLFVWDHAVAHRPECVASGSQQSSIDADSCVSFYHDVIGLGLIGDYWYAPENMSDVEIALLSGRQLADNIGKFQALS